MHLTTQVRQTDALEKWNAYALIYPSRRHKGRCQKKTGLCRENSQTGGGSDPNPLLDVYLPSYFWHAKMAPNQSCMPLVMKKNGNVWETFPTKGGGVT